MNAQNVKMVDQPIVDFWNWIQGDIRFRNRTTVIVVADHGRHRYDEPRAASGRARGAPRVAPATTSPAGTGWLGIELRRVQADAQEHCEATHQHQQAGEGVGRWLGYATCVDYRTNCAYVKR